MTKAEKRAKPPPKQKAGVKRKQREQRREAGHDARFDQLLDDAIFGVKKKNPRG